MRIVPVIMVICRGDFRAMFVVCEGREMVAINDGKRLQVLMMPGCRDLVQVLLPGRVGQFFLMVTPVRFAYLPKVLSMLGRSRLR